MVRLCRFEVVVDDVVVLVCCRFKYFVNEFSWRIVGFVCLSVVYGEFVDWMVFFLC